MRRRFRILLIAFPAVVVAAGLIWLAPRGRGFSDPIYGGRKLTTWLNEAYGPGPMDHAAVESAQYALAGLGANALPCLTALAAAKDSPLNRSLMRLFKRSEVFGITLGKSGYLHNEAVAGFHVLRGQAGAAVPSLSKLLNDPGSSTTAARILADLDPAGIAAITNALTNTNWIVRENILTGLGLFAELPSINDDPGTGPESMARAQEREKLVAPIFLLSLSDSNAMVCQSPVRWLPQFGSQTSAIVPALTRELSNTNPNIRVLAAQTLAGFGTNAKDALPALIQSLTDTDMKVRIATTNALKAIAPAAAPTAL